MEIFQSIGNFFSTIADLISNLFNMIFSLFKLVSTAPANLSIVTSSLPPVLAVGVGVTLSILVLRVVIELL